MSGYCWSCCQLCYCKNFLNFEPLGPSYRIWSFSSLRFESRWNWKSVDYTWVTSQYQFPESNQPVLLNSFGFNGLLTVVGERVLSLISPPCLFAFKTYLITILSPRPNFHLAHLVELSSSIWNFRRIGNNKHFRFLVTLRWWYKTWIN